MSAVMQRAHDLEEQVLLRLRDVCSREDDRDIVSSGQVYDVVVTDGAVRVLINPQVLDDGDEQALADIISQTVESIPGVKRAIVKPRPESIAQRSGIPGVRRIIGVHSGKGGVGKSTVTANLAVALQRQGFQVGILDADVYGPSIPTLFGLGGRAELDEDGERIAPREAHGVKIMSLGFLLPEDQALVWRGSLVDEGLPQLFDDIHWGLLDVLLVDLPPGTSDVHLAVARSAQLSGVITVTAPGQVSIDDVRRGLEMFGDIAVPCLGLVENMAGVVCVNCQHKSDLFGSGGVQQLSEITGIPMLATLPFSPTVALASDSGIPAVNRDAGFGMVFDQLAATVATRISIDADRGLRS